MPPKAIPVQGVYEREPGSNVWYVRFRVNGKLVRKSFGHNRKAAIQYVEKARSVRTTGEGVLPDTAKGHVLNLAELELLGGGDGVTMSELCDDYLEHVQTRPDLFKDQRNPPKRVKDIREKFGSRLASSIKPKEIDVWLSSLFKMSTRGDGRKTDMKPKAATLNRLKAARSQSIQPVT